MFSTAQASKLLYHHHNKENNNNYLPLFPSHPPSLSLLCFFVCFLFVFWLCLCGPFRPLSHSPNFFLPSHLALCVNVQILYMLCVGWCVCTYVCVWVRPWSSAALCPPNSASILLYGGRGLEVSDHTGVPPAHHWLLSRAPDTAERLHRGLLRPAASYWPRAVHTHIHTLENRFALWQEGSSRGTFVNPLAPVKKIINSSRINQRAPGESIPNDSIQSESFYPYSKQTTIKWFDITPQKITFWA